MFAHLAKHKIILVTGPHRSGTTICARMIAHDTGHDFVIEDEIGFSQLHLLATFIQADYGPVVVQCPFLSHIIHDLKYLIDLDYDDVLVVMMHRYKKEIIRSEMRSKVDFQTVGQRTKETYRCKDNGHASDIKYQCWEEHCTFLTHAMDIGYESLKEHPLWMEDRSTLKFEHDVRHPPLPKVFRDGINAIHNI